jgi:hypothetical protein
MDPMTALEEAMDMTRPERERREYRSALRGWLGHGGLAPRIAIHPACSWFMRGAKYGTVVGIGPTTVTVKLEVGGAPCNRAPVRIAMGNVLEVLR